MIRVLSVSVLGVIMAVAACSSAATRITIDNFNEGSVNLTDTTASGDPWSGAEQAEETGLNAGNVLGTHRKTKVNLVEGQSSATATLSAPPATAATCATTGPGEAVFQFGYNLYLYPELHDFFDFESGGQDRFRVVLGPGTFTGAITELGIWISNGPQNYACDATHEIDGPGVYDFLYSEFNSDLESVDWLYLNIISPIPGDLPVTYVIDDFSAIPEPATLSLLALGGLAVLGRRRNRQ